VRLEEVVSLVHLLFPFLPLLLCVPDRAMNFPIAFDCICLTLVTALLAIILYLFRVCLHCIDSLLKLLKITLQTLEALLNLAWDL
jgi:hypothetical protein